MHQDMEILEHQLHVSSIKVQVVSGGRKKEDKVNKTDGERKLE